MTKTDCYFYEEIKDMGAHIPCCTFDEKIYDWGHCPCKNAYCYKYINRDVVKKIVRAIINVSRKKDDD